MMITYLKRGFADITLLIGLICLTVPGGPVVLGQAGAQQDKPVEQVQKNIRVLTGMPNSQLLPVMHLMRASLGVRCDYCHVAENGKYWMDDKPAKQAARRMLQMVAEINQKNFGGQPVVTCNSCHRGQTNPAAVPGVGQGAFANTTRVDPTVPAPDPLPSVDAILEKYVQALGGRAAIGKITSRATKLTLLRPKLVNGGTPAAAMIARAESWPMEIYLKAPNKYLAVITSPDGVIQQGFNGVTGWVKSANGQREMNSEELAQLKRQADLYKELKLKEQYASLNVTGREKVGEREAYVIEAKALDRRAEKLFFDVQSGLLLRRVVLTETLIGLNPEQTDFQDYREVAGVKLPFIITTTYLDDNHLGTAHRLIEIKHNVPVDDAKFDPPAAQK
ncbi:MAG: c-type cytochrome [Acidobacteriota bacterium]|nr:c-type cytochrome [Acidobacteriota bacterium]